MVRLRSMVFATFMLALVSALVAVQVLDDEHFKCPPPMKDFCACNVTGPTTNMLKLCFKRINQAFLCKQCDMKDQTYLNCSECSVPQPPVCDNQGFKKWNVSHMDSRLHKGHFYFYPPIEKIFTPTPVTYPHMYVIFYLNSLYKMHNISHSPFYLFKINNCENSLEPLSEIGRKDEIKSILFSDVIKKRKELKKKIISNNLERFREKQKVDKMLYKLCNSGLLSEKHKICRKIRSVLGGTNYALSNLRYRREAERTANDDLFGMADKAAKMLEEGSTTSLRHRYERKSTKEDTVTDEAIVKNFRTRKPSSGKKHPPRFRGKKYRKFNKNRKQKSSINPQAKFKSVHLGKGSHTNKVLLDKQTTSVYSRFDKEGSSSNYRESDKVNATYITYKNDVPLSDISRDVSATSSFFRDMGSTEAPWVPNSLYNKQFSEQISWNSSAHGVAQLNLRNETFLQQMNEIHKDTTEHDLSYRISDKQPTAPEWGFKSLSNAVNSRKESFMSSTVFRGLPRLNDTSYFPGFPTDSDMSSNESTKYREGIKTTKRHDPAAINTSSLTASTTLEEVEETVYIIENSESDGVKRADNFINRSPHTTDEQLVKTNSSRTSKGKNVANEMGMPYHYESKFLVTSSDQSDSNYIIGQHLFNTASSGRLIETGETDKANSKETVNNLKNIPFINNFEENERLMHLLPSVQDKNDGIRNTNSKNPYQTLSTTSSSLREQDFSPNATKYKVSGSKVNEAIVAVNEEQHSNNISDVSLRLSNQQGQMINSPSRENENRDKKSRNSGNLTFLSSHISFTENGSEEYSTVTSEYKLIENQTFGTSQKIETFAVVTSNLLNQQQQNSDYKTFIKSGSIRDNELNFSHAKFIYSSTDKNDTNQTFLGETSEHTIDKNKTKQANQDETSDEKLKKIQIHSENNKFDGMKGNIRTSESTETGNRDNLSRNFSGNENKALSFSYEITTKYGERNQTVGYKRKHIFDHYTKILQHFTTGEPNATGSKESISDHVDKLNFRHFKFSEIQKNSSEHFIGDVNTHSSLYYRTTKYDDNDYESSTTLKHDNTTINQNQTTIKNNSNMDNGMIESFNLESGHSNLRYKRDQPVVKNVNKVIQYSRKNFNDGFHNKTVLLNFIEDFLSPSTVIKQNSVVYNKEKDFHIPKKYETVLGFVLNSSDYEKDQGWFYNGTTKKVEKANKGILKSKNIGMKYKSNKAQGMSLNENVDEFFATSLNSKEISKDTSLQKTNEMHETNANDTRKKYINPKFRTGRKLLQFSVTDNNKLVVSRDGISFPLRNRRSLKHLPENHWCTLPEAIYYGKLDCTVWSYQKACVMTCTMHNDIQGSDPTEYKCARKKNVWEPKFQPCESSIDDIDLKAFDEEKESRDRTLPTYDYITGGEEYDEYLYKFEGNYLDSDE